MEIKSLTLNKKWLIQKIRQSIINRLIGNLEGGSGSEELPHIPIVSILK